jgi:hypothetical protein
MEACGFGDFETSDCGAIDTDWVKTGQEARLGVRLLILGVKLAPGGRPKSNE